MVRFLSTEGSCKIFLNVFSNHGRSKNYIEALEVHERAYSSPGQPILLANSGLVFDSAKTSIVAQTGYEHA